MSIPASAPAPFAPLIVSVAPTGARLGKADHASLPLTADEIARAAASEGKYAGIGGVGDEALLRRYIGMGMRFILGGNDFGFMMAAAKQRAKTLRAKD